MTRPFTRLLHLGNVVVDVVLNVPALPEPGGDVFATGVQTTAGGGFSPGPDGHPLAAGLPACSARPPGRPWPRWRRARTWPRRAGTGSRTARPCG